MESTTLITLRQGNRLRTFPFDRMGRTVLWIGMEDNADSQSSIASVETTEKGLLVRSLGGLTLVMPAQRHDLFDTVLVDDRSSVMIGICRNEERDFASLYVRPYEQRHCSKVLMAFNNDVQIEIGRENTCDICYKNVYVSMHHAKLLCEGGRFYVRDLRSGNGTFVNGEALVPYQQRLLACGDVVQILDFWVVVGKGYLVLFPTLNSAVSPLLQTHSVDGHALPYVDGTTYTGTHALPRFYPAPWLLESMQTPSMSVDPPPERVEEEDESVLMQIGPSVLMGLSTVYMGSNVVSGVARGDDLSSMIPSICMMTAMLGTTIIWPIASNFYNRKRRHTKELKRKERYVAYLDKVEGDLRELAHDQARAQRKRYRSVGELLDRVLHRSPLLMNHLGGGTDFLCLRVGIQNKPIEVQMKWPQRGFSITDDSLWDRLVALQNNPPLLSDVPSVVDLHKHFTVGVIGVREMAWEFLRGMLVQLCALYSYLEVKLVLFVDAESKEEWEPFLFVPHVMDNQLETRLVATTPSGASRIDALLEQTHTKLGVHYVVVCTNTELLRHAKFLRCVVSGSSNVGVSTVFMGEHLYDLPRECGFLIDLAFGEGNEDGAREGRTDDRQSACMFVRSEVGQTTTYFNPDIMVTAHDAWSFALGLTRLRLGSTGAFVNIRTSLGFLDLFLVGRVAHLDIAQRWKKHDASRSLAVPVGIGSEGALVEIDLHERADGPHGLIAGTTGSGKSEFIITFVLSLCVSFSPDEVAFLFIDYKGGGLAGAFDNDRYRLPHVAGTITNLDGNAIGRALVSLRSELRRRQSVLNEARAVTGEATMDIHRYLSLYRQGVVRDPMPHLMVIADEFAELKQQEPAFMDELMSAARIGRSLGIHLLLATQKPSGVINDQIWANARLKVSLKVSDAEDSREMIRRDDAALLKNPGSFYALIGYDEGFWGGQAAYAGNRYVERDQFELKRDDEVSMTDDEGQTIASLRPQIHLSQKGESELNAVLVEVARVASMESLAAHALWLPPLEAHISLEKLEATYAPSELAERACIVGEVDDPLHQARHLLCLDFAQEGNTLIYGTSEAGVEGLLRMLFVSFVRSHGVDSLWMYALDYGEGSLRVLEGHPCVGGVVGTGDDQRTSQLFRLVEAELEFRRQEGVAESSQRPLVMFAIANLPAFLEEQPVYEERLTALARDAGRFGVCVMATADGPSSVYSRLRSSFGRVLPTILNDAGDYAYVLGTHVNTVPPRQWRRGLVLQDEEVREFQGVMFGPSRDEEDSHIQAYVKGICETPERPVPPIPEMPSRVTRSTMGMRPKGLCLPVGYEKQTVCPLWAWADECTSLLVVGNDRASLDAYAKGVIDVWEHDDAQRCCVLDVQRRMGSGNGVRFVHDVAGFVNLLSEPNDGYELPCMVLMLDAPLTIGQLPVDVRMVFERMMANEAESPFTFVLLCEAWRLATLFDDWYRSAASRGNGVWVGGGFGEQTVFRLSRIPPAYGSHTKPTDGFYIDSGKIQPVQLLEVEE